MGIAHITPKPKHIFPNNCILFVFCSLLFLIKLIAVIIKAIISTKSVIIKYQNKIILGAFSIINVSSICVIPLHKTDSYSQPIHVRMDCIPYQTLLYKTLLLPLAYKVSAKDCRFLM